MSYQPKVYRKQGGDELVIASGGKITIEEGGALKASKGIGALAAISGLTVEEFGDGVFHKTVFTFDAVSLTTLDNGTAGHGAGSKIYDFPLGVIAVLGASQNWDSITIDGTGLTNVAEIDIGIGTTVATSAMGSLTGAAQNIVNKDDITLSSSLSALDQFIHTMSGGNALDGSATAVDAYLNVAATAATADANGTIVLTGTVTVYWANLGAKST